MSASSTASRRTSLVRTAGLALELGPPVGLSGALVDGLAGESRLASAEADASVGADGAPGDAHPPRSADASSRRPNGQGVGIGANDSRSAPHAAISRDRLRPS